MKTWTIFLDLLTGGNKKTKYDIIAIKGAKKEAIEFFEDKFDLDPYNQSCHCCGDDFGLEELDENKDLDDYLARMQISYLTVTHEDNPNKILNKIILDPEKD
jgi:hypothetical protein